MTHFDVAPPPPRRGLWIILFVSTANACNSDYNLAQVKTGMEGDAGEVDAGPDLQSGGDHPYDECYNMNHYFRAQWNDGNPDDADPELYGCFAHKHAEIDHSEKRITRLEVFGLEGSAQPVSSDNTTWFEARAVLNTSPYLWPQASDPLTESLPCSGIDGDWNCLTAEGEPTMGTVDTVYMEQTMLPTVEILDEVRADGSPTDDDSSSTGSCQDYNLIQLCYDTEHVDSHNRVPFESTCSAGAGNFRLVPTSLFDKDQDGQIAGIYRAIQTSGTGSLTNGASIQTAAVVQGHGASLRVLRANRPYRFGTDDQLAAPTLVSRGVTTQGVTFMAGDVPGAAPWVVSELPGTTPADFEVSLSWSCDTLLPEREVNTEPGFVFGLSQLGCNVSWPQKFVVRPTPILDPTALLFYTYGSVSQPIRVPLTNGPAGRTFSGGAFPFTISGSLLAWGGDGATIQLDSVSVGGASVCAPGSYPLSPE